MWRKMDQTQLNFQDMIPAQEHQCTPFSLTSDERILRLHTDLEPVRSPSSHDAGVLTCWTTLHHITDLSNGPAGDSPVAPVLSPRSVPRWWYSCRGVDIDCYRHGNGGSSSPTWNHEGMILWWWWDMSYFFILFSRTCHEPGHGHCFDVS